MENNDTSSEQIVIVPGIEDVNGGPDSSDDEELDGRAMSEEYDIDFKIHWSAVNPVFGIVQIERILNLLQDYANFNSRKIVLDKYLENFSRGKIGYGWLPVTVTQNYSRY